MVSSPTVALRHRLGVLWIVLHDRLDKTLRRQIPMGLDIMIDQERRDE
jgi:hypothetical protein